MVVLPPPPKLPKIVNFNMAPNRVHHIVLGRLKTFLVFRLLTPPYTLVHVDLWYLGNDPHPTPCPKDYIRSGFVSSRVLLRLKGAARNSFG